MFKVASHFAVKSSGKFRGCIGALDGWLVHIKKSTLADGVNKPRDYFSIEKDFTVLMCRSLWIQKRGYCIDQYEVQEVQSMTLLHSGTLLCTLS